MKEDKLFEKSKMQSVMSKQQNSYKLEYSLQRITELFLRNIVTF